MNLCICPSYLWVMMLEVPCMSMVTRAEPLSGGASIDIGHQLEMHFLMELHMVWVIDSHEGT